MKSIKHLYLFFNTDKSGILTQYFSYDLVIWQNCFYQTCVLDYNFAAKNVSHQY